MRDEAGKTGNTGEGGMGMILWRFWLYSFLGYLLEKAFAAATRSPHQVRKCFFLMPMCPVYGLAVMAVLALPAELTDGFWPLAWWGGLTATAGGIAAAVVSAVLVALIFKPGDKR